MRKIGKLNVVLLWLYSVGFVLLSPSQLLGQDYSVEATVSENQIFIGEQFTLSIQVSGTTMRNVSLPVLPEIDGVRVLSTTPSRSTSISIVNARTSTTTTYSYALIAQDTGSYTIPPVTIEIDGAEVQTDPIDIEILQRDQLAESERDQNPDIYLRIELDQRNVVPGQQIIASLVLYFKQGIEISSFQPTAGWRTDGFWKEELQNERQPQAESVIVNGVRYRKATLIRYALFPSRSGELTLAEFPLTVGVRTQPSRNDPFGSFFGSGANQRRISLESEPLTLNVGSLPAVNNALSINAVGDLRVQRRLSQREVVTGESIELITVVEGTGNIPLIRKPDYNLPDGLEYYSPQENSNIQRTGSNISGEKTFTELMAPRAPGRYVIPSERVAVFNPQTRSYRYITLPEIPFNVTPSAERQLTGVTSNNQTPRLQPVTGLAIWENGSSKPIFSRVWFWLLLLIPLAGLIIGYQKRKLSNRLYSDRSFARAHYAKDVASDRIQQAKSIAYDNDAKEVYNLLHKTVTGYISDRLNLPEAGLSDREILEAAKEAGIVGETYNHLRSILDKCATISYAPTGSASDFKYDINRTESLITELSKQL
tara:strand:- start:1096 stop:2883 length:1788 start_codon:yes stop_codon:yes gene_type:complete